MGQAVHSGAPACDGKQADIYDRAVTKLALEAGYILLENGAEIFRVEETMERICHHYGVYSWDAFVLSNGIFVTADCRVPTGEAGTQPTDQIFAKVRHIPVGSTNLERVAAVNQLSREIADGKYTIEAAQDELEHIKSMPGKSRRSQILASAAGSAAFCCLFGGGVQDCLVAFIAGLVLYVFVLWVSAKYLSKIMGNVCGGALVTILCGLLHQCGIGSNMNYMIIGAIIPLIPGMAFTSAIRDVANSDYISGFVRMLDALLGFFCIAFGVGTGFYLLNFFLGGGLL